MTWIFVAQYRQCFLEFALPYLAVSGQVSTCWTVLNKMVALEEGLSARVIAGGEVDLCKEEGVFRIICESSSASFDLNESTEISTSDGQKFVSNINGRLVLMLVQSIFPPLLQ